MTLLSRSRDAAPGEPPIFTADFVLVSLATLFYFTAFLFFFPVLPTFIKHLGGRESDIGLLFAMSSMTSLVLRPFIGQIIDMLGSRRMAIAGAAIFVLTTLSYNVADNQWRMVLVRIATGLSISTFVTASSAYIAHVVPETRRGEAIGYYGLANNLAFALGPLIAVAIMDASWLRDLDGALTERVGWLSGNQAKPENFTLIFLAATVFALIGVALTVWMGEADRGRPSRFRWSPGEMFCKAAVFPGAVNAVQSVSFAALITFVILMARDRGMADAGRYFFFVYAAGLMLVRVAVGRISDRYGRGAMIVPGLALVMAGLLLTGFARNESMLWTAAALYGIGAGTVQPALMALTVDLVRPEERGRAMGTFSLSADLGITMGAALLGLLLERTNYETMYAVTAAIVAAGMATYLIGSSRFAVPAAARVDVAADAETAAP